MGVKLQNQHIVDSNWDSQHYLDRIDCTWTKWKWKWSHSVLSDSLDPVDCSLSGSLVHGIFQARVLEWVAICFSRGSSRPRDWTQVSRIVGRCFTIWATRGIPTRTKRHANSLESMLSKPFNVPSGKLVFFERNHVSKFMIICQHICGYGNLGPRMFNY